MKKRKGFRIITTRSRVKWQYMVSPQHTIVAYSENGTKKLTNCSKLNFGSCEGKWCEMSIKPKQICDWLNPYE